ncbi:PilZ domain-containing protein [Pseudomonas guariconensis]|uniref:PilZ domain-containing protein n=1 Tax=Pseudomonas TaxID=286 RepID=UPI0020983A4B|nr:MULTISPECIES: PilZ domain-containing protein [Pseudomonas]MCO7642077.1 PilZ domain-containing protein [Pseudomonas sp. S 311-6]MCO7516834.1 PilZ domain-containing protein [Pseudomonas putida]MCO7566861.1 PilZ domain-containing protein [Pseudomonas mosselii]MCO7596322.1 PilZ domain-containing protein [Pseudomonas guariconensis]MCO7607278.1 PilZ domain-containing protein [Pseudomonas guariconensis]
MCGYLPHPEDIPVELTLRPFPSLFRRHLHTLGLGGIACKQLRAYRRGMAVEVAIPSLGSEARYPGYIAWCQKLDEGYRVGIAFTDAQALFGARMGEQVCQIRHYCLQHQQPDLDSNAAQALAAQWVGLHAEAFSEANLHAT